MDYDALTSRIAVLSVALSGIESYVAEETMLRKMAQAAVVEGSPRKKGPLPLELVRARLDAMHGKICTSAPSFPHRFTYQGVRPQLIPALPILTDLEQRVPYNASRCAYIINALPFPRPVGNSDWAPSSVPAATLVHQPWSLIFRSYLLLVFPVLDNLTVVFI
ncbi:hypothetical protein BJV78DRAFT_1169991 [Lactifluus subvellereus]|nr:hypothetical protein BJV78DRAFT_1169991 [Lactifluus subvellereus]